MHRVDSYRIVYNLAELRPERRPHQRRRANLRRIESSLGDYARKVRKDPGPKAKPKVFDNDNLPMNDKLSIVGQAPLRMPPISPLPQLDSKEASGETRALPPTTKRLRNKLPGKLAGQAFRAEGSDRPRQPRTRRDDTRIPASRRSMYADAGNRIRNSGQWDKKDADYKQKIADKQKAVDDAKQKLDDLKEEARKAGVPSAMIE